MYNNLELQLPGRLRLYKVVILRLFLLLTLSALTYPKEQLASRWRDIGQFFPNRPLHGRIYGQKTYRPFSAKSSTGPLWRSLSPDDRQYFRQLRASPNTSNVTAQTDLAVLDLLQGKWNDAVAKLDRGLLSAPHSYRLLIDSSAAHLERGLRLEQPLDILTAISRAQAALALRPDSEEALFNYQQAVKYIFLRHQEAQACQKYLRTDHRSKWASEVRRDLKASQDESFRNDRELFIRTTLSRRDTDPRRLSKALDLYASKLRETAEEGLFGSWAKAIYSGDTSTAEAYFNQITTIARRYSAQRHDYLLEDSVTIIKSAKAKRDAKARLIQIAEAHRLFQAGMKDYHSQNFNGATIYLSKAEEKFRKAKSPFEFSAMLGRAVCLYYGNTKKSKYLFKKILAKISRERYPSLTGRTLWMLGTAEMTQGRFQEAIQMFLLMRPYLQQGDGESQSIMTDVLLGEAYDLRGEVERGWVHRLYGLSILTVQGDLRRRHSVLLEAAQALARRDQENLAILFINEVLDNAERWGQPLAQAEAASLRSRVKFALGDPKGALRDARQALIAVQRMTGDQLRMRTKGSALMSMGMAALKNNPLQAMYYARQAYALQRNGGWNLERLLYLNTMAKASLALHETREAHKFLEGAIQTYEHYRSNTLDADSRIKLFRYSQASFDTLIDLCWHEPSDGIQSAFFYSERSRARHIIDAKSLQELKGLTRARPAYADSLARRLPKNTTLIEYAVLPEKTLVWILEEGLTQGKIINISKSDLQKLATDFRQALSSNDSSQSRSTGARLFGLLLGQIHLPKKASHRLIIVPDGPLNKIPFSALVNTLDNCYLAEQAKLITAPSATVFLSKLQHNGNSPLHYTSALIVAAPDLSQSPYSQLPQLFQSRSEALQISQLYPKSATLTGDKATRPTLLKLLPKFEVLHLATHTTTRGPNGETTLLLLTPTSRTDQGEISVDSIKKTLLRRRSLVVIAACSSMNGYEAGRESPISIASAFLTAGASTVIAPFWDINDKTTSEFMVSFHRKVSQGEDPAAALQETMIEFIKSGDPTKSTPSRWASFSVLGV